jgi:hypothetical protein
VRERFCFLQHRPVVGPERHLLAFGGRLPGAAPAGPSKARSGCCPSLLVASATVHRPYLRAVLGCMEGRSEASLLLCDGCRRDVERRSCRQTPGPRPREEPSERGGRWLLCAGSGSRTSADRKARPAAIGSGRCRSPGVVPAGRGPEGRSAATGWPSPCNAGIGPGSRRSGGWREDSSSSGSSPPA